MNVFRSTLLRSTARRSYATTTSLATESAQKALSGVLGTAQGVGKALGQRAEGLLGAYKEPILGNAAVARELLKQVYVAEKLSPPSLATVQQTYQSFYESARNPSFWKDLYESGQWKKVAIYAVEAYGIFKLGEIIGRRHIVGYKLKAPKAAHAAAH